MIRIVLIFIVVCIFIYFIEKPKNQLLGGRKKKLDNININIGGEERERVRRGSDSSKYIQKYGDDIYNEIKILAHV